MTAFSPPSRLCRALPTKSVPTICNRNGWLPRLSEQVGTRSAGCATIPGSRTRPCRNCVTGSAECSILGPSVRSLDPLHILVAEPEMMADFVDQHVTHQMAQIFAAFTPVIEDRPAIEKDHIEVRPRIADALVRQRDAAIEAENIERAVETHRRPGLLVGELLDPDHDAPEVAFQLLRDSAERRFRQRLDVGERWRQTIRHGITPAGDGGWNGRKTGRSATANRAARAAWLGRGRRSRCDPQALPFRELLRSLGLHVANSAPGRKNGPPSRAVQRLQPGRGDPVDA